MSKKILIINTGGTLSSVKGTNGLIPGMSSNDMLEELRMVSKKPGTGDRGFLFSGQRQYRPHRLGRTGKTDQSEKL